MIRQPPTLTLTDPPVPYTTRFPSAPRSPDVGGDALEGHDGHRARVLGDLCLLGGDHVHDHTALEHLGHAALDARGSGSGTGGFRGISCHAAKSSARWNVPIHRSIDRKSTRLNSSH